MNIPLAVLKRHQTEIKQAIANADQEDVDRLNDLKDKLYKIRKKISLILLP